MNKNQNEVEPSNALVYYVGAKIIDIIFVQHALRKYLNK